MYALYPEIWSQSKNSELGKKTQSLDTAVVYRGWRPWVALPDGGAAMRLHLLVWGFPPRELWVACITSVSHCIRAWALCFHHLQPDHLNAAIILVLPVDIRQIKIHRAPQYKKHFIPPPVTSDLWREESLGIAPKPASYSFSPWAVYTACGLTKQALTRTTVLLASPANHPRFLLPCNLLFAILSSWELKVN